MATKRRRKKSDRPTVEPARANELRCDQIIPGRTHLGDTVYERRCIGTYDHEGERHLPGPWTEIPSEVF